MEIRNLIDKTNEIDINSIKILTDDGYMVILKNHINTIGSGYELIFNNKIFKQQFIFKFEKNILYVM